MRGHRFTMGHCLLLVMLVALAALASAPAASAAGDPLAALAVQQAELTASDGVAGDYLGYSVALDGDTALVGASDRASVTGAAYVFTRTGTTWTQQQVLTASDGVAGDNFGFAVALDGDTALVGAPFRSFYRGAAYVFTRSGGVWTQQGDALTASDAAFFDTLGFTVALNGDTALIGAPLRRSFRGAAYVFTRSGGVWTQQGDALTAGGAVSGDGLGSAVAVDGHTALVGACFRASSRGAAYVFTSSGGVWSQAAVLTASDGAAGDGFARSAALDGDTALIGAPYRGSDQGAAYVFTGSGGVWTQQGGALTASDGVVGDQLGLAVALDGDVSVIGAPYRDSERGAAYVWTRNGTVWAQQGGALSASDGAAGDFFGIVLAFNGKTTLAGAPGRGSSQGAAYVYVPSYTITPSVTGDHGTIRPSTAQTVQRHATPTFTFDPGEGYAVGRVLVDGVSVTMTGADEYTFAAVEADHTISVGFKRVSGPPPVTTVSGAGGGWSRRPVKLRFTAVPAAGGEPVAYTEHRVAGGSWVRGTSVTVTRQGVTRVSYRSVDTLGDVEPTQSCTVRVDTKRPRVLARAATGPAYAATRMRLRVDDAVPGSGRALVRLVVVDARGQALTRASTRPAPVDRWRTIRISTGSLAPGAYTVVLRAVDVAGNFQSGVTRTTLTVR